MLSTVEFVERVLADSILSTVEFVERGLADICLKLLPSSIIDLLATASGVHTQSILHMIFFEAYYKETLVEAELGKKERLLLVSGAYCRHLLSLITKCH